MNPRKDLAPELAELWGKLEGSQGRHYWRSLEELGDSQAFQELLRLEFPEQADTWPDSLSRRRFLALMGASLALAGVAGCSIRPAPARKIVPFVRAPELLVPGKPLFYATAMTLGGCGVGLLVESHMGRPTKVEGNLEHPASLGATDIFHQASVLELYDPDRSQSVMHLGLTSTWDDALAEIRAAVNRLRKKRGEGLHILTETVVSPTLGRQLKALLQKKKNGEDLSQARWHQYEPLARDSAYRAAQAAFGEDVNTWYDFRNADVVLSFDSDFLGGGPGHLRYVADFMGRRRVRTSAAAARQARMNRLYVVETALTNTGAKADHRLALPPSAVEKLARALAARLGVAGAGGNATGHERWVEAVARDLEGHPGRCVVLAGDRQPVAVHLLAHALNERFSKETTHHTKAIEARPEDHTASLRQLAEDMRAKQVKLLVILGGNPVYNAPADLGFAEALGNVDLRAHLGLYQDETSRQCQWHLPEAHFLEAWGDTRAFDGTASLVQPLIEPLYQGRSAIEVVQGLVATELPGLELVQDTWRQHWKGLKGKPFGEFEDFWETALHDGVVRDREKAGVKQRTGYPEKQVTLATGWQKHLQPRPAPAGEEGTYEIAFQADPTVHDGRFANNGWLQELPKPLTRLTWDNAAVVSPATAKALKVGLGPYAHGGEHGGYEQSVLELRLGETVIHAPVWIQPGHADGAVTVHLGYGRDSAGRVGGNTTSKVGFNAYLFRTSAHPWSAPGLKVTRTPRRYLLACTQGHHLMENRATVRAATLAEFHERPNFAAEKENEELREEMRKARRPLTLYEPWEQGKQQWGMAIDLTTCVGCGACVVACQSENNIPVVGKDQVSRGREMHWLRVDLYHAGPAEAPTETHFQPVPCMHCERAPCEYVCPTAATVHSHDGLNDMVYQRCVGTRFCSNNCPYKVRRFNFLASSDFDTPSRRLQFNPNVTVRSRGVMEKCTYCVQRIRAAGIGAQKEGRGVRDGEILTACQAACPAQAIVFGNIADRQSAVAQWKGSPLNYALLADLNTEPRTTYLAALRNPNPEL
jgi:molybdopterin-containing oxidoreductase family iron-sulfur binding subunit